MFGSSLIKVTKVLAGSIHIIVLAWHMEEVVELDREILPAHLSKEVQEGQLLVATVNLSALHAKDLKPRFFVKTDTQDIY